MKASDVIAGEARWSVEKADCRRWLRRLPDRCVSLVFFSPPYGDQRTYGVGFNLTGQEWVDWLRPIVLESARVSSGLVVVNAAGQLEDFAYQPIMEWLVSDLTRVDGLVCGPSPYAWVKSVNRDDADGNGVPGSGSDRYHRRDWEPLYTFCLPDRLPLAWSDNTAFGKPPKYAAGGECSNRLKDGTRVNDPWRKQGRAGFGERRQSGKRGRIRATSGTRNGDHKTEANYAHPKIANPGNVVRAPVGGGKLGHPLAHDGEAPMSLHVAERFVCWFAAPDSIVCDPFTGSGTTPHAAFNFGRRFIGCDLRGSQVELTRRRLSTVTPALFVG